MDDRMINNNYKGGGVKGTSWGGGGGVNGYILKFETDDKKLYEYMEKAAQKCIDIARRKHFKKNKNMETKNENQSGRLNS